MGDKEFLELIALPSQKFQEWHKRQLIIASRLRTSFNRNFCQQDIRTSSPSELPEATEIVNETVRRILDDHPKYIRDGADPLDKFFARCLRTTCSSLREAERRHRDGKDLFIRGTAGLQQHVLAAQDDIVANEQYAPALAAAIATTSMTGAGVEYAKKLGIYATEKWTLPEIAADLGVKEGSIDSLRRRLRDHSQFRRSLKDPENE